VAAYVLTLEPPMVTTSSPAGMFTEKWEIVTNSSTRRQNWLHSWVNQDGSPYLSGLVSQKVRNIYDRPLLLARGMPVGFALGALVATALLYLWEITDWWRHEPEAARTT
jgi:hypothetical protein